MDWLGSPGDSTVSTANPIKNTTTIKADGTIKTESTSTMSGYPITKAESTE